MAFGQVCRQVLATELLSELRGEHNSVLRRAEKTHHAWKGLALIPK